jgi:hypothetical protein
MIEVVFAWLPPSCARMLPQALMLAAAVIIVVPLLRAGGLLGLADVAQPASVIAPVAAMTATARRRADMIGSPRQQDGLDDAGDGTPAPLLRANP